MTIVDFLIDLVMTPGASIRLIPAINVTLVALLGLLLYLGQDWAIEMHHLYTMTGLAIALLISVNWFLIEFKAEQERQEKQKKEASNDDADAVNQARSERLRRRTD